MTPTTFENKCSILAELWMNYRNDQNFEDFISYNDLGLPLAYAIANKMAKVTETGSRFIVETFELLLASLEVVDVGFDTLNDIFESAD